MKKGTGVIILTLLLICVGNAMAAPDYYLEPDSSMRVLCESDLWKWDYEALGYVCYEVLARHGYHFQQDNVYHAYFSGMEWYQESEEDNEAVCKLLTQTEWDNIDKIQDVREQMRQKNINNEQGLGIEDVRSFVSEASPVKGFTAIHLGRRGNFPVYNGPGESYGREGGGKAELSTNGPVFCAGYVGDWLCVLYETSNGAMRLGYISYPHEVLGVPELAFENKIASITQKCEMTEDPLTGKGEKRIFEIGQGVTYLWSVESTQKRAYIEYEYKNGRVRGCIPYDAVQVFDQGELEYRTDDLSVIIKAYNGSKADLVLPDRIDGKTVRAIDRWMMGSSEVKRRYDVETVYIPDSVRNIGERAFCRCMNLRSVRLPSNLRSIDSGAFFGCENLIDIEFPQLLRTIRGNAFAHCVSLSELRMPSSISVIGDAAFANTRMQMIVDPDSAAEKYAKEKGISYIYVQDYNREEQNVKN